MNTKQLDQTVRQVRQTTKIHLMRKLQKQAKNAAEDSHGTATYDNIAAKTGTGKLKQPYNLGLQLDFNQPPQHAEIATQYVYTRL